MAARAYWQGQIRLALVSIPVEIYTATKSSAKISFHQIHQPSGKRVSYEKVVSGIGPVDRDEIVKGYELSRGNYVLLKEEEIEAVRIESKKTLELVQFVGACEIDPLYFDRPYYVAPADELAEEAYIVLRDALRDASKLALGQLSVRGQEKLVALKPCGRGLLLETLRYSDEVLRGQTFFAAIPETKPDRELLELAGALIEKRAAPFDAREFEDRYALALKKLIDRKAKSKTGKAVLEEVEEPSPSSRGNVIDLMSALKKSVGQESKPAKSARKAPASRSAGRKRA